MALAYRASPRHSLTVCPMGTRLRTTPVYSGTIPHRYIYASPTGIGLRTPVKIAALPSRCTRFFPESTVLPGIIPSQLYRQFDGHRAAHARLSIARQYLAVTSTLVQLESDCANPSKSRHYLQ